MNLLADGAVRMLACLFALVLGVSCTWAFGSSAQRWASISGSGQTVLLSSLCQSSQELSFPPTGSHSALGVLSSLRSLVMRSAAMSVSSLLFIPRMTSTHLPLSHLLQILCFGSQVSFLSVGLNKSPDVWLAHC